MFVMLRLKAELFSFPNKKDGGTVAIQVLSTITSTSFGHVDIVPLKI